MNSNLTLELDSATLDAALEEWRWKIGAATTVILTTLFGDIFFKGSTGEILWLNTGAGSVIRAANSEEEFRALLETETAELWLLPQLVEQLNAAGKVLAAGQCYTLVTPPIFKEGKYEVRNIAVVPAIEHFRWSADIHKQVANLPDGAQVRIKVID